MEKNMPFTIANKISRHQFNKNFAKSKCEKLQNTLKRQTDLSK